MPDARSSRIAEVLAQARAMGGQQGEPGLESPLGQRLLENAGIAAGGYGAGQLGGGIAQLLAARGVPALQELGQAGAIFPEGAPISGYGKDAIKELEEILPPSQMNYRRNEAIADWHARNVDFPRDLKDKWSLLVNHHGG